MTTQSLFIKKDLFPIIFVLLTTTKKHLVTKVSFFRWLFTYLFYILEDERFLRMSMTSMGSSK